MSAPACRRFRVHGSTIHGSICWWGAERGPLHCFCSGICRTRRRSRGRQPFTGWQFFFNYPHYMATLYRAYHTSEDFRKYRIFTVHITGLIVLTLILSHFWYRALPWLFTIYLTWSPWHYSGQNYGLFMMFARRAGAKPSENERQSLYSAFLCSYLILFLTFHTGASQDPLFISLGIPEKLSLPIMAVLAVAFVGLSTFGLSRLGQQIGWRATGASADAVLNTIPLVPPAHGIDFGGGLAHHAKPLQQWRAGGHAFGAISVDHQLLCAARGQRGEWKFLAPVGLFRRAGRRRHRAVCAGALDRQPRFSLRPHGELSAIQRVGQHSSFHSGWSDLETARWTYCRTLVEFAPAGIAECIPDKESAGCGRALAGGKFSCRSIAENQRGFAVAGLGNRGPGALLFCPSSR